MFYIGLAEMSQRNAIYSLCLSGECKQLCLVQRKILFSLQGTERNLNQTQLLYKISETNNYCFLRTQYRHSRNMLEHANHVHVHVACKKSEVIPMSYNIHADSSKSGNLLKPLRLAIFSMQFVDKDSFLQNQQFQMISTSI